jgi:entericidin B
MQREIGMTVFAHRTIVVLATFVVLVFGLASCGNTIRGIGNDLSNTVNATQAAGRSVANAVR